MRNLRAICRNLRIIVLAAVCWLAAYSTAWAQESDRSGGKAGWIFAYALVILGVVLGMLLVCKSSRRRDRPKSVMFADAPEEED